MKEPLISVIIPTHKALATLPRAIESIQKQTYKNLEIIVVDDNSTDQSVTRLVEQLQESDPRIRVIQAPDDPERFDSKLQRNVNAGYSARNAGFAIARGELITFQDADDVSLLNRIETQYRLLTELNATHLLTAWQEYDDALVHTIGDTAPTGPTITPNELYTLSQKTKGLVAKISPSLNRLIPFHYKRLPVINKFFFGSLAPFPGAGNSPLFKREVIDKVQFRKLTDREWPSFMGRGADRDFNFKVAEVFRNSYVVPIPLYLWRTNTPK